MVKCFGEIPLYKEPAVRAFGRACEDGLERGTWVLLNRGKGGAIEDKTGHSVDIWDQEGWIAVGPATGWLNNACGGHISNSVAQERELVDGGIAAHESGASRVCESQIRITFRGVETESMGS